MIASCWLHVIMDNVNPDISSSSHHVDTPILVTDWSLCIFASVFELNHANQ